VRIIPVIAASCGELLLILGHAEAERIDWPFRASFIVPLLDFNDVDIKTLVQAVYRTKIHLELPRLTQRLLLKPPQ